MPFWMFQFQLPFSCPLDGGVLLNVFLSFSLWGFLRFGPLFFHETRFHETHDKTWKMSKLCEDCSKEAYLIATSYMYESLHCSGIWQVQFYTVTTRATMAKLTKGESRWQNVTLGYEKWLWVGIIEKETFKYRLQVHRKNVEVYIADTCRH